MMLSLSTALISLGLFAAPTAQAGSCDSWVRKAGSAKGEALVQAYKGLARCDAELARTELKPFMLAAGDLETLVPLTLAGIQADAFNQAWDMMGRVPYEHRVALAEGVGAACATQPKVVTFLQGAHAAMRGTAFASWQPALGACQSDELASWMEAVVLDPPTSPYNEKYNAILTSFVERRSRDALPTLQQAAITVGNRGGPFPGILQSMQEAVQPRDVRAKVTDDDRTALEEALVAVARAVPAEQAKVVADRLDSAGSEARAASLLPHIFPYRVQPNGELLWVAAAIERCEGDAVVHWTSWTEAPTRLAVADAAAEPLRNAKSKLKCDSGEWPVVASLEPMADDSAVRTWLSEQIASLEAQGLKVKDRQEGKVAIN